MPDDIYCNSEAVENISIPITVNHLFTVPKGVVILDIVMNGGVQTQTLIINGIALKHLLEEVIGSTSTVVGFIHHYVAACRIALTTNQCARKLSAIFGIEDSTALRTR